MTKLKVIHTGNVVRFLDSYWIVCDKKQNDKLGQWYPLLSMYASNCASGVYEFPSDQKWHINQVEIVADCVYDFIQMGILKFIDDLTEHERK